ncbi:primosomal protein N' [Luteococcus peritonei]|uniref:Probable replication restart protein PriA n=1 Tax=Luteococcus peritonei TaxID=88874 RepID=A0ABW4RWM6_9ACTN
MDFPVARCALDVPLPHLDRFFDYEVAEADDELAVPGARVRVRFAGRQRDGFVVERLATSEAAKLSRLEKVVSPEPVLQAQQVELVRAVADHCGGSFSDVMRLAVPPRHAATEKAEPKPWPQPELPDQVEGPLSGYPHGTDYLDDLAAGGSRRVAWTVAPSTAHDPWQGLVQATVATLRSGRGVMLLVPDVKDLEALRSRLAEVVGAGCIAVLHADLGPSARYRNFLALARGTARVVVGTRAAAFAPVADLGLVALWDDGDDLWAEPRAPYFHTRDVAAIRATQQKCSLLFASRARSCELQLWVDRGWLAPVVLPTGEARRLAPAVRVSADSDKALERDPLAASVRLPNLVFQTIRAGLAQGPVLVQVPRSGYLVALSCQTCRTPVRCPHCQGPVRGRRRDGEQQLSCAWCGRLVTGWQCPTCGDHRLRAPVVGAGRTTEELGRAFPGTTVLESSGEQVKQGVGERPALVIATPGAEPPAAGGYAAAVLLDATVQLSRPDLRVSEETLRRWLNVLGLVRSGEHGGTVAVVGPSDDRTIQALVRVDPVGFAERELAERFEARLPPAVKFITLDGSPDALQQMEQALELPEVCDVLGPVPLPPTAQGDPVSRLTLRTPLAHGRELTAAVKAASAVRSARKDDGSVRVSVDPAALA